MSNCSRDPVTPKAWSTQPVNLTEKLRAADVRKLWQVLVSLSPGVRTKCISDQRGLLKSRECCAFDSWMFFLPSVCPWLDKDSYSYLWLWPHPLLLEGLSLSLACRLHSTSALSPPFLGDSHGVINLANTVKVWCFHFIDKASSLACEEVKELTKSICSSCGQRLSKCQSFTWTVYCMPWGDCQWTVSL